MWYALSGVFEKMAGRWGRRRQPVRLCAFEREAMALYPASNL
jgi:hypothetical protein